MYFTALLALLGAAAFSSAHTVITYPGWRGDNLITNDTFPYGMQWMYPCTSSPYPPPNTDYRPRNSPS